MKKIKILAIALITLLTLTTTHSAWAKAPPGNDNTVIKKFLSKEDPSASSIGNASYDPVTQDVSISQLHAIIPERNIARARPGPLIGNINIVNPIIAAKSPIAYILKKEKTTWSAAEPAITGNNSMPIPAD